MKQMSHAVRKVEPQKPAALRSVWNGAAQTKNLGQAKTLYIIHGWTYSVEPWAKTIELLEKAGVTVKMLNVPGLTTPSKRVWTIKEYVAWADKHIPDGAIALGHSNGGRILLNLCSKKPAKLKKLILLDAAGVYEPSKKREILKVVSKLGAPLKKVALIDKLYHKLIGASDYHRAPENMKQTLTNMLESDKELVLATVTTPTAILWGEDDTITPPRQAHILKRKLADSTLSIHPGWTHAPYISDPSGLAKAVLKELK
ncbi:alpha/beta hydrolase [Candidatus Saccharibacteria bacterium]|nr:alpha/beta hydrolase [Candidatus Saccharibacteria bacterium]